MASVLQQILRARGEMIREAQKVLDAWEQDDEGWDEEFGAGGACDQIADCVSGVLGDRGFDVYAGGHEGDDHAWTIACKLGECFGVDIPYSTYERGGGYSWEKIPDVRLTVDDVVVWMLDASPEDFEEDW